MRIEIKNYSIQFTNRYDGYSYIMLFETSSESTLVGSRVRLNFIPMSDNQNYSNLEEYNGVITTVSVEVNLRLLSLVIDILRNEKPVYFSWNKDRHLAIFGTGSDEPIGEEETGSRIPINFFS